MDVEVTVVSYHSNATREETRVIVRELDERESPVQREAIAANRAVTSVGMMNKSWTCSMCSQGPVRATHTLRGNRIVAFFHCEAAYCVEAARVIFEKEMYVANEANQCRVCSRLTKRVCEQCPYVFFCSEECRAKDSNHSLVCKGRRVTPAQPATGAALK